MTMRPSGAAARVYTPAFAQNGREGTGSTATSKPGQLRADVNPKGVINVTFLPTAAPAGALIVEAAPLANGVTSDVRRGENAGRKLTHEFVAMDLIHATLEKHDGAWTASLPLPPQSVASATRAGGVGASGGQPDGPASSGRLAGKPARGIEGA